MSTQTLASNHAEESPGPVLPRLHFQHLISIRGIALAAFIAFLLSGPVPNQTDIVATVLAYILLALLLISFCGVLFGGLLLRNSFRLSLLEHFDSNSVSHREQALLAGRKEVLLMQVEPFSLLPLFFLRVKILFKQPGIDCSDHLLLTPLKTRQHLKEELQFPHRGNWHTAGVYIVFQDQLGLSSLEWRLQTPSVLRNLTVGVADFPSARLPIISSSTRTGDTLTDVNQRQGDYFDLKPYHPSDGMRRILWKVYAKSGELISRHPERAMTPEGRTAIFVMATKSGDQACGACVDYLKRLDEAQIEYFVGCCGMGKMKNASSLEAARELLIDTVWNSELTEEHLPETDMTSFLGQMKGQMPDLQLSQLVIFCARQEFDSAKFLVSCRELGLRLSQEGIQPVFAISQARGLSPSRNTGPSYGLLSHLKQYFVRSELEISSETPNSFKEFSAICGREQWPVILLQ